MIHFNYSTLLVYGLLTAAILSIWLPPPINRNLRVPIWVILSSLATVLGLYYGIVEVGGVLYLAGLGLICHLVGRRLLNRYIRITSGITVIALVAGLFLHKTPFFNNPLVFDQFHFSDHSSVYTQYWNFDKAAAGLILLAYFGDICRATGEWKLLLTRKFFLTAVITITLTLSLALVFGQIRFDPKLTPIYFAWAWANLFFTCIAEEMLFRGFVQKHLVALTGDQLQKVVIVIFVGILFGLAHLAGGVTYAVLAAVAGIGYGYIYHITGRIETAILTHFMLNSVHFLLFTYPHPIST